MTYGFLIGHRYYKKNNFEAYKWIFFENNWFSKKIQDFFRYYCSKKGIKTKQAAAFFPLFLTKLRKRYSDYISSENHDKAFKKYIIFYAKNKNKFVLDEK